MAVSFLRAYLSVIFGCVQRYSKSHFVFVQSSDKYRDETESILKHPAVHGIGMKAEIRDIHICICHILHLSFVYYK